MLRTSALAALAATFGFTVPLSAQIGLSSSPQTVQLTATKHGSVSVALPAGGAATIPSLVQGLNDFSPVPVTTSWNLDPAQTASVTLVAFFDSPAWALAGAGDAIPASAVQARVGGAAFLPVNQVSAAGGIGTAGGSLILFSQAISAPAAIGSRTDDLQMRIDLTTLPGLAPGTYTGTLALVAVTQ
jgi:hypothetical protein